MFRGIHKIFNSTSNFIGNLTGYTQTSSNIQNSEAHIYETDNGCSSDTDNNQIGGRHKLSQSMPVIPDSGIISKSDREYDIKHSQDNCKSLSGHGDTNSLKSDGKTVKHNSGIPILKHKGDMKIQYRSSHSRHGNVILPNRYPTSVSKKSPHIETSQKTVSTKSQNHKHSGKGTEHEHVENYCSSSLPDEQKEILKTNLSVKPYDRKLKGNESNGPLTFRSESMFEIQSSPFNSGQKRQCISEDSEPNRWSSTQSLFNIVFEELHQNTSKLDELNKSMEFLCEGFHNVQSHKHDRRGQVLLFNELFCYVSENISVWRELLQHLLLKENYPRSRIKQIQEEIKDCGESESKRTQASLVWWRNNTFLSDEEIIQSLMDSVHKIGHYHVKMEIQKIVARYRNKTRNHFRTITEELLLDIAKKLGKEWKQLAFLLGFSTKDLYQLEYKSKNAVDTIHRMLLTWFHSGNSDSGTLVRVFIKVDRADLLDLLKPVQQKSKWFRK